MNFRKYVKLPLLQGVYAVYALFPFVYASLSVLLKSTEVRDILCHAPASDAHTL